MSIKFFSLTFAVAAAMLFSASGAQAVDYRVEPLQEAAPGDELAPAVAEQLEDSGVRVIRGESRKLCDIWLCKQWPLKSFESAFDIIYPFAPGQLVGVIRFHREGADFRDQEIPEGIYTLRYSQQPVDGAHVGTSPTRDFLLMLPAAQDQSADPLTYNKLVENSAEVAGAAHPTLLSLQRTIGETKAPSIREDESHDWWIVRLKSTAKAGDEEKPLPIDLVVVGVAPEA